MAEKLRTVIRFMPINVTRSADTRLVNGDIKTRQTVQGVFLNDKGVYEQSGKKASPL